MAIRNRSKSNQFTKPSQINESTPHSKSTEFKGFRTGKKLTLDQLPQVSNDFKNKTLNFDEQNIAKIKYYYGKYILFIKFPARVQYAIKPNFSQVQSALEPFCDQSKTPSQNKIKFDQQGNISLSAKFLVDAQGQIQNIRYTPLVHEQMKSILQPLLEKIRFQPRNENGVAKSFSIEQPLIIQCH